MLYSAGGGEILGKIAAELERALAERDLAGGPGGVAARILAQGGGLWQVSDVVCTSGPADRAFEERHAQVCIALVVAGSFGYRSSAGAACGNLMTPGSIMLGNTGQAFECGHEHGRGDRCVAFHYAPEYFERLTQEANETVLFRTARAAPARWSSPLLARACAGLTASAERKDAPARRTASGMFWEELAAEVAIRAARTITGYDTAANSVPLNAAARVTEIVRRIERAPQETLPLDAMAMSARLSPYHFLRTFEALTGTTPHQFVLRTRLREAALRLIAEPERVIDIAYDCGFGDVSNFNHAFRAEFGVSPRAYRNNAGR